MSAEAANRGVDERSSSMALESAGPVAERLLVQAGHCERIGSPLYAGLLERAAADFEVGGPTEVVLRGHEEDPDDSMLALRLMGAVNRLVLRGALELAARVPATVEPAGAPEWIGRQLADPATGRATVVYHSIVLQYLGEGEKEAFLGHLREAAARATPEAPLAWLRMEPAGDLAEVRLTTWPGGEERLLARAGYHGSPVEPLPLTRLDG